MASYLIKHTKDDSIKFVGHLDLFQAVMRNITRADIGAQYSKGFNPHMLISSAQPLPVGTSSDTEYILIELITDLSEDEIKNRLNETSPEPIRYLSVRKVPDNTKSPMALLRSIESEISIKSDESFTKKLTELLNSADRLKYKRTTKKGNEIETEMKDYIISFDVSYEEGYTVLRVTTKAGSVEHLSLEHLINYIVDKVEGYEKDSFIKIKRLEMYTEKDGKYVRLEDI